MILKLNHNLAIILLLIVFGVSSCQKNDIDDIIATEKIQFHLKLSDNNEHLDKIETKSIGNQKVKYFLSDKQGNVLNDIFTSYDTQLQRITIEPVRPGQYELFVLAYTPALEEDGLTVASDITHKSDTWIHFPKENIGLLNDRSIVFGKCQFTVGNITSLNTEVILSNVLTAVELKTKFPNEYVRNILTKVSVSLEPTLVNNSLSVDGGLSGSVQLVVEDVDIEHNSVLYTLPTLTADPVHFNIDTETINHERVKYHNVFVGNTSTALKRGVKSTINIDLSNHPDANSGVIYVSSKVHDSEDRPKILQDSENKSVFYDARQRSFIINKPLQISITDDSKLHTRFYSPLAVRNVGIWAKFPDFKEEVLIAFLDSIPAFSDAKFDILIDENSVFKTRSNKYVSILQSNIDNIQNAILSMESPDIYFEKINTIRCDWRIAFRSFGGNPDMSNGGPAGNWMGIRPVHIREGIAILTNVAYMLSSSEFETFLASFQGKLYGNKGKGDIIDVTTITQRFLDHSGYDVGLVYTGNGVLGMGGGRTWGVAQYVFYRHYMDYYSCNTIFHELSHTIGYSHTSNMTYGIWAGGIADVYYVNNILTFPVNSQTHLNTASNPSLY